MKTKKYLYNVSKIVLTTFLMLSISACTDNFEEINTPPRSSITIDPGFLLTNVQRGLISYESSEGPNNDIGSWVQQWGGGPLFDASRYVHEEFDRMWDRYYGNFRNLGLIGHDILAGLEDDPTGRTKIAISKIMAIYFWQTLTDMYGPVPYSESLLPTESLIRQPKFDTQENIYNSLISDLDVAMSQLNAADESYGMADVLYNGDVAMWMKFGNSIKLRLGMRLKYVDEGLSKSTVESALSSPLISSNAENADMQTYNDIPANQHPILGQSQQGSPDAFYLAEKFVDVLVATADPRVSLLGDLSLDNSDYKGVRVAEMDDYYSSLIRSQFSQISSLTYFNQDRTIPMHAFSFGEVSFFKAEAALEGWGGFTDADAENFYQEGIIAAMSMEPYNIAEADIPPDYITAEFSLAGLSKEEKLEKIMTQKWILLFGRNIESWTEWRRTGYPVLVPGPFGVSAIPRRLIYPVNESVLNSDSYGEAISTLSNGDTYQSKVWWDNK